MASGFPPRSKATTGSPYAIAESMAQANGSWCDGKTNRSVAAYTLSTSGNKAREFHSLFEMKFSDKCLQAGLFPTFSREEQDAMWKLRAQFR